MSVVVLSPRIGPLSEYVKTPGLIQTRVALGPTSVDQIQNRTQQALQVEAVKECPKADLETSWLGGTTNGWNESADFMKKEEPQPIVANCSSESTGASTEATQTDDLINGSESEVSKEATKLDIFVERRSNEVIGADANQPDIINTTLNQTAEVAKELSSDECADASKETMHPDSMASLHATNEELGWALPRIIEALAANPEPIITNSCKKSSEVSKEVSQPPAAKLAYSKVIDEFLQGVKVSVASSNERAVVSKEATRADSTNDSSSQKTTGNKGDSLHRAQEGAKMAYSNVIEFLQGAKVSVDSSNERAVVSKRETQPESTNDSSSQQTTGNSPEPKGDSLHIAQEEAKFAYSNVIAFLQDVKVSVDESAVALAGNASKHFDSASKAVAEAKVSADETAVVLAGNASKHFDSASKVVTEMAGDATVTMKAVIQPAKEEAERFFKEQGTDSDSKRSTTNSTDPWAFNGASLQVLVSNIIKPAKEEAFLFFNESKPARA